MESCLNMGKKNQIPDSLNYDFCFHCDNRVKKNLTSKNIKMLLNSELRHARGVFKLLYDTCNEF